MTEQQATDADLIEIGAKAAHDIDPWPMDEDVSSWDQLPETEWIEINGVESIAPKQSYRLMAEAVIAVVRPIIEAQARAEGRREVMKHLADEAAQNVADLRGNRDEDIQANAIHWYKTEAWLRKKIEAQARAQQRREWLEDLIERFNDAWEGTPYYDFDVDDIQTWLKSQLPSADAGTEATT